MKNLSSFANNINLNLSGKDFTDSCIEAFNFHKENNPVYREFLELTGRLGKKVKEISDIVFLPVSFFRNRTILPEGHIASKIFRSSSTTGSIPSCHYVSDVSVYINSLKESFRYAFGEPSEFIYLALLPSYLERNDSSLVFMVEELMKTSNNSLNGFYLNEYDRLKSSLEKVGNTNKKCIFIGVTFALLDFAEKYPFPVSENISIIETGGMKGRSMDIPRTELHEKLCKAFSKKEILGEYGMTELLSQSYSSGKGIYKPPPWVKILTRDLHDPFNLDIKGKTGGINVIDLANFNSCPFIATDDAGSVFDDESFIITGRVTNSDIRGCNLMV